ncbi:GTPase, partial [Microcoleus sp. MON2_D5]|uniref:GTPase n=1 Tax=Microcoleus sp. MON2_D5 TaxID=2818833 RepID=UPI002FD64419
MNFDYSDFFDSLTQTGLLITEEQRQRITEKITQVLSYEPKIGIFGKTGVGKSCLCNALFGQDIAAISDIEACTRNPQEILLKIGQGNSKGIKLIDVPGVGESQERDQEYAQLYAKLLPELDVVLWLLKGDDRAFTSDEVFYKNVVKPHLDRGKVWVHLSFAHISSGKLTIEISTAQRKD